MTIYLTTKNYKNPDSEKDLKFCLKNDWIIGWINQSLEQLLIRFEA